MRFLRSGEDLRKKFEAYFSDGLSPAAARKLHWDKIRKTETGTEDVADRHQMPSKNTLYYWYKQWTTTHFGNPTEPLDKLEEKVEFYEQGGSKVVIKKTTPWVVLVATPIMIRAHSLQSSKEISFVDTTSSCDTTHTNVTLVLTATKVGAIPLCILLHESQTTDCYTEAFNLLKLTFPHCFGGNQSPEVFMTDNATAEKDGLNEVWPDAIQLLCHFHVGQQEWKWLSDTKHKVEVSEKQILMRAFQKIMYARTTEDFEESLEEFRRLSHEGYKTRIEEFLERKEEWAKLFRDHIIMRGHHTTNLAEASIRILKDVILERIKAYNVVALVDYVIIVWDSYLEQKIMNVSHKLDNRSQLLYQSLLSRMDPKLADKITKEDEETFMVPSAGNSDLLYEVNSSIGVCLCKAGTSGAFCKHQALVHHRFGGMFPNAPAVTSYDRYQLGRLALGDKCPEPTRFLDMDEDPSIIASWNMGMASPTEIPDEIFQESSEDHGGPLPIPSRKRKREMEDSEKDEIFGSFLKEWERLRITSDGEENFFKYLMSSTQSMKKLKTSTSATGAALRISAALRQHTSRHRRGKILVQPTSTSRRVSSNHSSRRLPAGRPKTHGCSRTSVGRPTKGDQRKPKRRHILSQSVKNNVPHVRKH